MIERILLLVFFLIGFYGIIARKNLIKKIFGLTIINSAVVMLFILESSETGTQAPIMGEGISNIVDPVPQALMLTAIVIGVCITALALAMAFRLYKAAGTFDIEEIRKAMRNDS